MDSFNWKFCNKNSDLILACGIENLLNSQEITNVDQLNNIRGNYLITHNSERYYVGEAKELKKRIRQQFKEKTSTFYKNYLKSLKYYELEKLKILDFSLFVLDTNIGRKEVEEFAIVNLHTKLNKFNKGKRDLVNIKIDNNIWEEIQNMYEDILIGGVKDFLCLPKLNWFDAVPFQKPGIYSVEDENEDIIYIGESSNLYERYQTHSQTTYFSALRRHIGTEILGFNFIDGKKRKFSISDDAQINMYLNKCTYRSMPVVFGRFELEEYLIKTKQPILNRKGNK